MGENKNRSGTPIKENSPKSFSPYLNEIDEDEYLTILNNLLMTKR